LEENQYGGAKSKAATCDFAWFEQLEQSFSLEAKSFNIVTSHKFTDRKFILRFSLYTHQYWIIKFSVIDFEKI
jgi:hypothetical protein